MSIDITLEEIGPAPDGEILADSVRMYRADCQAGQFKIGASKMIGHRLDMELIGAQISEGEYFGYPQQKWLALLFVDPQGVLSSVLCKTESLDNFEELRRSYRLNGESLLGKTIRASMSKRVSRTNGTGYFAVEFEIVANGKYAMAVAKFRQQHYSPTMLRIMSETKPSEERKGNASQ